MFDFENHQIQKRISFHISRAFCVQFGNQKDNKNQQNAPITALHPLSRNLRVCVCGTQAGAADGAGLVWLRSHLQLLLGGAVPAPE